MITKPAYATLTAVAFIVGTAFTVDGFYQRKAEAAEQAESEGANRERGDLETQLQLARLELDMYLKLQASDERAFKLDYLKVRINALESRLRDLAK